MGVAATTTPTSSTSSLFSKVKVEIKPISLLLPSLLLLLLLLASSLQ